ncbi:aminoglycoside phosphotransferase [Alicyclobacillus hesperidum URH17-3-68]|nr:aminoglycoside phosphotransferase [Alicyclobacillus hesperidum URH17-3-68]
MRTMPKSPRTKLPDWVQQLIDEFTRPPYFLNPSNGANQNTGNKRSQPSNEYEPSSTPQPESRHQQKTSVHPMQQADHERRHEPAQTSGLRAGTAADSARIPRAVLAKYEFASAKREQLQGVEQVTTEDGQRYAVKRASIPPARVRFMHRALVYARKQGFTRYAPFVLSKQKSPVVIDDGQAYYVTKWIDGQPAHFASAEHVAQTAYTLAQFHEATRGFVNEKYAPADAFDLFGMLQRRTRDLRHMLIRADAKRDKDAFDALLLSLRDALLNDAAHSLHLVDDAEAIAFLAEDKDEAGLCHLDVIPGNCLYTPDHHVCLIDFDLATYAPRALDMAHLLRRGFQASDWNGELAYACFLHFDAVRAIPKVEYRLVESLLRFPYLPWRLAHTRYRYFVNEAQLDELQRYALQEEKRQAFLSSLADQVEHLGEQEE